MTGHKRTVLVTGSAGKLASQLMHELADCDVVGVDIRPPASDGPARFYQLDLEREACCAEIVDLLRETRASAVVHLAFEGDLALLHSRPDRAWQTNVAGPARVLEAIAEVNRTECHVRQFIMPTSAIAYGPRFGRPATEEARLTADAFRYAVQKREADEAAQFWAPSLGRCRSYILRPSSFAGPDVHGYLLDILRGTPPGSGRMARSWRARGRRLQVLLPLGAGYLQTPFQFVHIDDMARLVARILRRDDHGPELTILNVAGRGEALPLQRCIEIAGQKVSRLPGVGTCRRVLRRLWKLGLASAPPEALSYVLEDHLADTARLHSYLGNEYREVIRYTNEEALKSSFPPPLTESEAEDTLSIL